jgi:hypothetical protein
MKDKRLDILLEHFVQINECQHYVIDKSPSQIDHLAVGFCKKRSWRYAYLKDGIPKSVNCRGSIKACELED